MNAYKHILESSISIIPFILSIKNSIVRSIKKWSVESHPGFYYKGLSLRLGLYLGMRTDLCNIYYNAF